jgi:hypothetical protein
MAAVLPGGNPAAAAIRERAMRRARIMSTLRRLHGWIGLWGAVLGFLMGGTGLLMSHRAIMKLPVSKGEQSVVQFKLAALPADPQALAAQIAKEFGYEGREPRVKVEKAREATFNGVAVRQPERWELNFTHPQRQAKVEYIAGNSYAKIEKYDATAIGTMMRLHQSTGVSAFWVLLMDSIAVSLMVLSLTGTLLWTQLRGSRIAFASMLLGAPVIAILLFAAMV